MPQAPTQFLAVIGGGNIAQAILLGGSTTLDLHRAAVVVAEPDAAKRDLLRPAVAEVFPSAAQAAEWLLRSESPRGGGQILLAIKPQVFDAVAAELAPALALDDPKVHRVVISVLAGMSTDRIRERLGGRVGVIRAMPNLPIRVREGMTALAMGAGSRPGDQDFASAIFSGFGDCVRIEESLMDAFTAVASSGPAYVFYLAEAMTRAAAALGFDPAMAERIVAETIAGAGRMLAESSQPPADLRAAVTSKGGTTEAALRVLESGQVADAFVRAITAARDHGRELSK